MDTLIELSNYSFSYHGAKVKALDDISFKINKGEYVSIIGPTGAGKTTICRSFLQLIPTLYNGQISGDILVQGKPIRDYTVAQLSAVIGYVHQDAESQIMMTNVEKEIAFPLENLGIPRDEIIERVENALKLVHLENYRTRHPYYLSGGQRQRVVLATALAMNPDVLVFDEATSEIDPLGAEEILTVTKELNDMGKTIIMIEHNMEEIARFSDRIILLNEGKILADDATEKVLTNTELMSKLNFFPPEVTQLFVALQEKGICVDKCPLTVEDGIESLKRVLQKA